jgi:hypothetical protein
VGACRACGGQHGRTAANGSKTGPLSSCGGFKQRAWSRRGVPWPGPTSHVGFPRPYKRCAVFVVVVGTQNPLAQRSFFAETSERCIYGCTFTASITVPVTNPQKYRGAPEKMIRSSV